MTRKVFIVAEDTYAPHALRQLLRRRGITLARTDTIHLKVCSKKMERIAKAHASQNTRVVIIADAEHESPEDKGKWIREKHGLGANVYIVVVDPCMEALACQALGLPGCRDEALQNRPARRGEHVLAPPQQRHSKRFLP